MIGERLEEARKRKGVTIREAAEATKIRGDFLASMEENQFDLGLPTIYVRGFLKNYARFLKLDPDRILTDFDAQQLGKSTAAATTRQQRESLGHVDFNKADDADNKGGQDARSGSGGGVITAAPDEDEDSPEPVIRVSIPKRTSLKAPPSTETLRDSAQGRTRTDEDSWEDQRDLFIKIGVIVTGVAIVALLIIVLVRAISGGGDAPPELNPELTDSRSATTQPAEPPVATGPETILITASDNVTVIVEQTIDRQRLYSGTLNSGERVSIEKEGPVSIRFTNGAAITITRNGEDMRPQQDGFGRTVID